MPQKRLQKIISEAGIASRRRAEEFISGGGVTINGKVAKLGDKADPSVDHIKVNGKLIHRIPQTVVLALFKPRNVLAQRPTDQIIDRGTIFELVSKCKERLFPIGRLESDVEGLILMTNNGDLSQRLNRPKFEIPKRYRIKIDGHLDAKKFKRLEKGMTVDGRRAKVQGLRIAKRLEGKEWLLLESTETRNSSIRRYFESVGHPVDKIKREMFANITLKGLKTGEFRYLSEEEILRLEQMVGLDKKPKN